MKRKIAGSQPMQNLCMSMLCNGEKLNGIWTFPLTPMNRPT